jgi:hypothetical protein
LIDMNEPLSVRTWLDQLRAQLGTDGLALSPAEQRALLDLTRVAAHRSERIAAPLSAFLAGVAFGDLPGPERAAAIERVTAALEAPTPDTEPPPAG